MISSHVTSILRRACIKQQKKKKYSESIFCPPSRSSNPFSNSSFDHFTRWAGTIAKVFIFSSPPHSARCWPQRECEEGTDRQKGFQINLSVQPLRAWLQFVRWKSGNAQVTDGTAATVSQGGFGRASHRWAAIPIRNAGPIPAIHQQGFQLPLTWAHSGCAARIHRLCIGIPLPVCVSAKSTASSELDSKMARCARIISNL